MTSRNTLPAHGLVVAAGTLVLQAACGAREGLRVDGAGGASSTTAAGTTAVTTTAASTGAGGGVAACRPGDAPVMLASGLFTPSGLVIDADFVYFATGHEGCQALPGVNRVSKHGGAVETLAKTMRVSGAIGIDGANVYWSDDPISPCTDPMDPGFRILAAPKGGGTSAMVAPTEDYVAPPSDLALDDTHVYWGNDGYPPIVRAPKGGGTPEVVSGGPQAKAIALFGDRVYWTAPVTVMGALKENGGGSPLLLLSIFPAGTTLGGIAADADGVYFGGASPCQGAKCSIMGFVQHDGLDGGSQTTIAGGPDQQPKRVVVDGGRVYWTQWDQSNPMVLAGTVMRVDAAGGSVITIASGKAPFGIAVDGACVYWTDSADGSVWRAPK
jgi:hypothetical protein